MASERLESRLIKFLADNGLTVQAVIDMANARFAPLWFPRYFRTLNPTVNLDFTTIIGKERLAAMAPVISRESEIPLRGRPGLEKLQGEVPAIALMMSLPVKEQRELDILLRTPNISNVQRLQQVFNIIFDMVAPLRNAVLKRIDAMCLQAVSTGRITVSTATNNAEGISFDLDLMMDDSQRKQSSTPWSDPSADILQDIEDMMDLADQKGKIIENVRISRAMWSWILKNEGLRNYIKGYNNPGSNAKYAFTRDTLNEALTANQLPNFEVVNELTQTTKDGKNSLYRAWNQTNAVFVPAGELGVIHNSLADEELQPDPTTNYSKQDNVLISNWRQRRPTTEFTAAEYNAFPGVEAIDSIFILDTTKGGATT